MKKFIIKNYKDLSRYLLIWGTKNIRLFKTKTKGWYIISFDSSCFDISKRMAMFIKEELFIDIEVWGK